jgi:Ca-activated chloride channel family protein
MRRLPLILILLLLTALPAHAQSSPGARVAQVDTSAYPIVKLYVSVTDPSGNPVPGLTARDFAITEDGQPVTIGDFAGGTGAINAVLVIDRSGSMDENDKMDGAKAAARAFVRQMRPGDRTAVIAFSNEPELIQPFTADTALLDRAIRRVHPDGSTALYDSLIAGVEQLQGLSGRRALLLLTDGRDIVGTDDPVPASRASLDEAIQAAAKAGISVQVIGLGDRDTDDLRGGIDEPVLERIADQTGGAYFYTPNAGQLADLYRRLSADMQQEYAITYRSPRPFYDGTRRDIRVSVGGAPAAAGGYLERHLIDVHSDPIVGLLLLLPILGALLLPALLRRRRPNGHDISCPSDRRLTTAASNSAPADGSTIFQRADTTFISTDVPRCKACGALLAPVDARFCMACGATQDEGQAMPRLALRQAQEPRAAGRRIFCDQCGRPMRDGARYCSACGATAPLPAMADG